MAKKNKAKAIKPITIRRFGSSELLERQKNKVRGIIGTAKRHKQEPGDREKSLRASVRRVVAEARYELPKMYRDDFFSWIDKTGDDAPFALGKVLPKGLIDSIVSSHPTSFDEEIAWIEKLFSRNLSELQSFVSLTSQLDIAFWRDDIEKCKDLTKQIEAAHGDSLWLINAEIALRQMSEGLEAQKAYSKAIRARHAGLPRYFAFHVSIRNEQGSTYFLFDEDFRETIEKSKIPESYKTYLLYKLTGTLDITDRNLADILQIEAGNSVFDLYETSIDLLQRCVVHFAAPNWTDAACALLTCLATVGDSRITKLLRTLSGGSEASAPPPSLPQSRELYSEHIASDFWQAAWPIVCSPQRQLASTNAAKNATQLEKLLLSIVHRDEAFEDSRMELAKFTRNFGFIRSARAAGDFADVLTGRVRNCPRSLAKPLLNSHSSDPLEALLSPAEAIDSIADARLFRQDEEISVGMRSYLDALVRSKEERDRALDLLDGIEVEALTRGQANLVRNLILQINLDEGESDQAIRILGQEIAASPSILNAVPASSAIGDRSWESLATIDDKVSLAIVLYALWKQTDDSLRTTHLRFAFEDVLLQLRLDFASSLEVERIRGDKRLLFFMAHICIPVLMDTSGLFSTTEELLDERVAILSKLAQADSGHLERYEDEAEFIKASKLIKSGLEIVDSNRVAVDTGALTRWAGKRYKEGYNRYQALRAAGIGSSDKFEALFEVLRAMPDKAFENFSVPENEADSLLLSIMLAIKDRFVGDEQYGLEYFLGKRIRHGTISGHIRGPVEIAKLITERSGPGRPYEPNHFWMTRLAFKSPECKQAAEDAFAKFSEDYDKVIAEARDRFLHVRSATHPDGLVDLTIDAFRYHIARSMIRQDMDFDNFLNAYFTILWSMLDGSLQAARTYLTETLKATIGLLYGNLLEEIRSTLTQDEQSIQLLAAIQATNTAVQRELDTVGNWFIRSEAQNATHMFKLEDVLEISIQSALKSLPNFTPTISRETTGVGKTTSVVMITIVDIVFIVFDNIHRRAKAGPSPELTIEFGLSPLNDRMRICITNPVGDELDIHLVNEKLERIRNKLGADDVVKGAFLEGESGLLKIAAHARNYTGATMSFNLADGKFETIVEFPVVYLTDRFSLIPPEDDQ